MKRVVIYLQEGFEDVEAIAPIDILRRAGVEVDVCLFDKEEVNSSHHILVHGEKGYISPKGYDAVILPGGGLGVKNLFMQAKMLDDIKEYYFNGGLVCAICAAPMILSCLGILEGKRFTCYAGCEVDLEGTYTASEVEVDGNVITARSMLYSIPFALAIVERLLGKEVREKVFKQVEGLNRK